MTIQVTTQAAATLLYQNELYEMVIGRAGMARLQGFGVIFGCNRVVIYIQPKKEEEPKITANIARTNLIYNGEPLPWHGWTAEFREKLPQEIESLQEEISAKSANSDHRAAIRDCLKRIRDLFRFSRYRPAKDGKHSIGDEVTNPGGTPKSSENGTGGGGGNGRVGRAGDVYSLFLATRRGVPAEEVNHVVEPNVKWVSVNDGTRIPPLLEDRTASYLPDQNLLQINADFRVFMDMVERWVMKFSHVPGARPVVEQVTREWFEQQLIETVMGTLALRQTGKWTLPELQKLWCEEALTAAVLPRYHVDYAINRALSSKLGSLKEQTV
jgi:hypothetical protein